MMYEILGVIASLCYVYYFHVGNVTPETYQLYHVLFLALILYKIPKNNK